MRYRSESAPGAGPEPVTRCALWVGPTFRAQKMELSPNRDKDKELLERRIAEQADQIKKLAEVAAKYKLLLRENNMLKSSQKPGSMKDLTEEVQKLLGELQKKDETIRTLQLDAKSVIDGLKLKHQTEIDALMKQRDKIGNCNPASLVSVCR
jgi:hypothetical protein